MCIIGDQWPPTRWSIWYRSVPMATRPPWVTNGWLCWGLTSQSTIFQSCRDGAIASWVINQYFRGVKCLAQGHNTAEVGLEPRTSRSEVRHSTTEPPRSPMVVSAAEGSSPNARVDSAPYWRGAASTIEQLKWFGEFSRQNVEYGFVLLEVTCSPLVNMQIFGT